MSAAGTGRRAEPLHERGLTVMVGLFMMLQPLATDLYLASLPGLSSRFEVSPSTVQLTLSVFVAAFGAMQLVSGPMSDRWGRRPVMLGGLALYVVASLACAASPGIGALIVARFAQAIGCCTVVVVSRAIIRDTFEPAAGARALARASTLLSLGPILGPVVGSLLEVQFGFRASFLFIAAMGAVLLAVAARRLPETLARPDPVALRAGRLLTVTASVAAAALALAGVRHYAALLVPMFGFLFAHGLVFPCAQAGATAAFPERAGAAAGLFGALVMLVAAAIGSWIGVSHDGTPVPLTMTVAASGLVALLAAWRGVMRHPGVG